MSKHKHLTIQIIPDSGKMKSLMIPYPVLWVIFAIIGVIVLAIGTVFVYYGKMTYKHMHYQMIEQENRELRLQVRKIKEIEAVLKESIEENRKIKQMLGIAVPDDKMKSFTEETDTEIITENKEKSSVGGVSLISQDIPNILPAVGVISQSYSKEHPAIDIAVEKGSPVVATISGRVVFAGNDPDLGNAIVIQNDKYKTVYGHNSVLLVEKGDIVKKGDIISLAGSTGHSSGPHVHYELYIKGKSVDPKKYIMKLENY